MTRFEERRDLNYGKEKKAMYRVPKQRGKMGKREARERRRRERKRRVEKRGRAQRSGATSEGDER